MYDKTDPRSSLAAPPVAAKPAASDFAGADYLKFYQTPPRDRDETVRTWYARAQNFVMAYSLATAGAVLERAAQPDEYAVLLPDHDSEIVVEWQGQRETIAGNRLVFVPGGASTLRVVRGGQVIRLFSARTEDLAALAVNAASYASDQPNVALLEPWPDPVGGFKIRSYSLDVPPEPGRFGKIWRCTTLMVNYLDSYDGPRDPTKLSPHHHDDFQQGSLALQGEFVHHLRWPWTVDMNRWRSDDHELCASPSLAVIPPPSIHTTQAIGRGINQLVDLFSPPRIDFSLKPGWVLNADDYPMPPTA